MSKVNAQEAKVRRWWMNDGDCTSESRKNYSLRCVMHAKSRFTNVDPEQYWERQRFQQDEALAPPSPSSRTWGSVSLRVPKSLPDNHEHFAQSILPSPLGRVQPRRVFDTATYAPNCIARCSLCARHEAQKGAGHKSQLAQVTESKRRVACSTEPNLCASRVTHTD